MTSLIQSKLLGNLLYIFLTWKCVDTTQSSIKYINSFSYKRNNYVLKLRINVDFKANTYNSFSFQHGIICFCFCFCFFELNWIEFNWIGVKIIKIIIIKSIRISFKQFWAKDRKFEKRYQEVEFYQHEYLKHLLWKLPRLFVDFLWSNYQRQSIFFMDLKTP